MTVNALQKNALKVLLICTLLLAACAADRKKLQFPSTQSLRQDWHSTSRYLLTFPNKPDESYRYFIRAQSTSTDPLSTPYLAVSSGDCQQQSPISLCVSTGTNSLVGSNDLELDITCMTDCEYELEVYMEREYRLGLGEEVRVGFVKQNEEFWVRIEVKEQRFDEVRVMAFIDNPEEVNGALGMYVNVGDSPQVPTKTDNSYKGEPIWNDGLGVFLNSSSIKPKQTIRMLLTGSSDMQVVISCFATKDNQRDISLNQKLYDDVAKNSTKVYTVDISGGPQHKTSEIYIKLTKYVGNCQVSVSSSPSFPPQSSLSGQTQLTITQISLTPKTRQDLSFSDRFYVSITGQFDSTFMLQTTIQTRNFTLLDQEVTELSTLDGSDVDNYLYIFTAEPEPVEDDNVITFTVGVQAFAEEVQFGVRKCREFQENGTYGCVMRDREQVKNQMASFKEIEGLTHQTSTLNYFTFEYDIRKCAKQGDNLFKCAFHIVCFGSQSNTKPTKYLLVFTQQGYQINLQQGIAQRSRSKQNQIDRYYFALPSIKDVTSVQFYLTEISGDCVLSASTDKRQLKIGDEGVQLATENVISYTGAIEKQYYLRVQSYSMAYYTLTAIVKRSGDSTAGGSSGMTPIRLTEGVSQTMSLSANQQLRFYICLNKRKDFYIQSTSLHPVQFLTHPSHLYQPLSKSTFTSSYGYSFLSNSDTPFSSSNQFIVTVTSAIPCVFSIVYNKDGLCSTYKLGQSVTVWVDQDTDQCFSYQIEKAEDLEIVVVTSYFQMTTGNMNVTLGFVGGQTRRRLGERVTVITGEELKGCFEVGDGCVMDVAVNSVQGASVTVAVQYSNDEMQLFDGIMQLSTGYVSTTRGRYFYYDTAGSSKPLMVSLKSSKNLKHRIVGKFTDWSSYLNSQGTTLYPTSSDSSSLPHADTTSIGTTALILHSPDLNVSNSSVLLLSVFTNSMIEQQDSFSIEVIQSTSKLMAGESKQGFVEKAETKRYLVATDGLKEIILHVNSYQLYCVRLELYEADQGNATAISKSLTGELIISPSESAKRYAVDVYGLSACTYEISYSTVDQRVYELVNGFLFTLELKPSQKAYFLYYNTRTDSFRVVSMAEYGMVEFNAQTTTNITNISDLIRNTRTWEFGGPSHDASLVVSNSSSYFCVECYYLIEVKSEDAASTVLVLHSVTSPVTLRENRVTRQTLTPDYPQITYALMKLTPFKISLTILFGTPTLTVTNTLNKSFSIVKQISQSQTIDVPYSQKPKNDTNIYDDAAFLINLKCSSTCSYTLVLDVMSFTRKMVEGLPHTIEVASERTGSCVQFLSLDKETSTYLHIDSSNASNIHYEVRCFNKDSWTECEGNNKKFLLQASKNTKNINLQLKSVRGYYYICLTLLDERYPLNATLLHSQNINLRFLPANTNNLMSTKKGDSPITIEMYNPNNDSVMVEVYECVGEIVFEATADYRKFMDNEAAVAEHAKTAGHYVVRMDPTETNSSMYFARVQVKESKNLSSASFLFRYSVFDPQRFPYSALGAKDTRVHYDFKKDKIAFTISTIQPDSHFNILSYQYKLFLSRDAPSLKTSVQCQTSPSLNQTIHVSPNQSPNTDTLTFQFATKDIQSFVGVQADYFFVSASCYIEVVDAHTDSNNTQTYRIIYDSTQLPLTGPVATMGSLRIRMKFVFLWVVFPVVIGLILVYFAVKYCVNRVKNLPLPLVQEEEERGYGNGNGVVGVTAKDLVMTGAGGDARPNQL